MSEHRIQVGMCFPRQFPAGEVTTFARALEAEGADQLWVIEDCFYTAGVSLAATALAVTERLTVGVGILPAVVRTAAVTAMELATLCELAPGRVLPGIGHGVQSWMAQMGVRPASPLTALDEVLVGVGRLLDGEEVSVAGQYVTLDQVRLDQPPAQRPPLLAGVQRPKSLALAGRVADGIVLAEPGSPSYVRWALEHAAVGQREAGREGRPFHVAVFGAMCIRATRQEAYREMAGWVEAMLVQQPAGTQVSALPFFDDLVALHARDGVDGIAGMPADWWTELGPIGTLDDGHAHVAALAAAGVHSAGFYPAEDVEVARREIADVARLAKG